MISSLELVILLEYVEAQYKLSFFLAIPWEVAVVLLLSMLLQGLLFSEDYLFLVIII